jgi:hypothetical protein
LDLPIEQPRNLRHRSHYKIYVLAFFLFSTVLVTFWGLRFYADGFGVTVAQSGGELILSSLYFAVSGVFYFFWLKFRLKKSIQVFPDHLLVHGQTKETIAYADIESVNVVCWSIFYVVMKGGTKHFFSSSFERADYIWEGINRARPELIPTAQFETYRIKLVQYDHHQKRKEWFFKHRMIDIFNWLVLPVMFVALAFLFQSQAVEIHSEGPYFFRLLMFALLILVATAFAYSIVLKKLVFDRTISRQLERSELKARDLEFEGMILQRSKMFQLVTATLLFGFVVKYDLNMFSVSRVKEDIASFKLKRGNTILIDNRYNCLACRYKISDGDFVVFGRGTIGQVLALEGDIVGQVNQDRQGRMIASENVQEVPRRHVAIKAANGRDIVFVKIDELIGKIQN